MSKYKIKIKEELPEEEILKYKDFEAVKKKYKRTVDPIYNFKFNKRKNMQRLFFLLLFLWILYMIISDTGNHKKKDNQQIDTLEITK